MQQEENRELVLLSTSSPAQGEGMSISGLTHCQP